MPREEGVEILGRAKPCKGNILEKFCAGCCKCLKNTL